MMSEAAGADKKRYLYQNIYEDLKKKILDGTYPIGSSFPFEQELREQYNVSITTMREATRHLAEDGFIQKRRRVGSVVLDWKKRNVIKDNKRLHFLFLITTPVVEQIHNPYSYHSELFSHFLIYCSQKNISMDFMAENDPRINSITKETYDGCFAASSIDPELLDRLSSQIPTICLNDVHYPLCSITSDDEFGAYEAVKHLIELGHRRIAMIINHSYLYFTAFRTLGYYHALLEKNIPVNPKYIVHYDDEQHHSDIEKCISDVMDFPDGEKPTAIFFQTDDLALYGINYFAQRGVGVPDQISIVGFNNTNLYQMSKPALSSVAHQTDKMTKVALEFMLDILEHPDHNTGIMIKIPPVFIPRGSIGPAPEDK